VLWGANDQSAKRRGAGLSDQRKQTESITNISSSKITHHHSSGKVKDTGRLVRSRGDRGDLVITLPVRSWGTMRRVRIYHQGLYTLSTPTFYFTFLPRRGGYAHLFSSGIPTFLSGRGGQLDVMSALKCASVPAGDCLRHGANPNPIPSQDRTTDEAAFTELFSRSVMEDKRGPGNRRVLHPFKANLVYKGSVIFGAFAQFLIVWKSIGGGELLTVLPLHSDSHRKTHVHVGGLTHLLEFFFWHGERRGRDHCYLESSLHITYLSSVWRNRLSHADE